MLLRWSLCLAVLAGCYQPTLHEGAPCGTGATCPEGQECRTGTCFFTSTPADATTQRDGDPLFDPDSSMVTTPDAPPDGPPYVAWGTPVLIPSLELPQTGEDDPSATADKLTVVIAAVETVAPINSNLFIGTRTAVGQPFVTMPMTALNTASDEGSPEISADGQTIWFTSDRAGGHDVYVSTFVGGAWAAPTLVTELSIGSNGDLAVSPDALTAVVLRSGTQSKFFLHTRASTAAIWGPGTELTALEITTDIAAPTITNGAQTIYFHAGASRDIYVSHKVGGVYQTPTPVAELNTSGRDAAPFVNQADNYMIFERNDDIYETTR